MAGIGLRDLWKKSAGHPPCAGSLLDALFGTIAHTYHTGHKGTTGDTVAWKTGMCG